MQSLLKKVTVCLCVLSLSSILIGATRNVPSATHSTIQGAIDAAEPGDTIIVAPGTYYENIWFDVNDVILTSTDPTDPEVVASTIIDGGGNDTVVTFSSESVNCKLAGFTITHGNAVSGGAIFGNGTGTSKMTQAEITNCIITDNTGRYGGGIAYCSGPITNCIVVNNMSFQIGGGLAHCYGPITNCIITGNNCTTGFGGGLFGCDNQIVNCIITDNTTSSFGGGLYGCDGQFINCTIMGNEASSGGGFYECDAVVSNCIIWDNSGNEQIAESNKPMYSCIQGWTGGGIGNIATDPMFVDTTLVDPLLWDLHLLFGSPCIDAGTNHPFGGLPATDIEGNLRLFDGDLNGKVVADMGAYEFIWIPEDAYLLVYPDAIDFSAYESGDNPADQLITVKNCGNQTMNWSADLTDKPDWLSTTPLSGSLDPNESELLTLSVDMTGLSGGQYSYTFDIADPDAQNSPQTVKVNLEVIGPSLDVSSNTFSFTAKEGAADPNDQTLTVQNIGGGTLNWSIVDLDEMILTLPDWLSVTPVSGALGSNETEDVTISIDTTGLSGGQYSYSFDVIDPAAENSPKTVTVNLQVTGPMLDVSSNQIYFGVEEGAADPNAQTLTIRNIGGGTLNWSIVDANEVTLTLPDWLSVTPVSGTLGSNETEDVTISIDTTGLTTGSCSFSFDVIDPAAQNSPQTVIVTLAMGGDLYVPAMYPGIQSAIDAAEPGDTIIVSPGTYYENVWFDVNDVVLTSIDPTDPEIVASTIIDGQGRGRVVRIKNTYDTKSAIRGFTITNGYASRFDYPFYYGYSGGGIFGAFTQVAIENCVIKGNQARSYGGGIYGCDGQINNCVISYNTRGGLSHCHGTISNCTIVGNTSYNGGGLYNCDGSITNCTITANTAAYRGGGLCVCDGSITNCTITANTAADRGGGFAYSDGSITNCIIWNNTAVDQGDQLYYSTTPSYSCIQDWTAGGTGNISDDPLFADADPSNGDYHLKSQYGRWNTDAGQWVYDDVTSPCIDAGKPEMILSDNGTPADPNDDFFIPDPDGLWQNELWPHGKRINMGAYGGTPQASMSSNPVGNIADLDHDDQVGVEDLILFSNDWLYERHLLDTDFNLDGFVNIEDFAELAAQWLWAQEAVLWIPDPSLSFMALQDGPNPDPQSIIIANSGWQPLNWIIDDAGIADWLTINKISGTVQPSQQETVSLSVDSTALSAGLYHTEFEVVAPAAKSSPQTVTVDLEVIGPILNATSNTYSFTGYEDGANPDDQILTVSNTGGSAINWTADLTDKPAWLTVTPTSGSIQYNESEPVTLSVNITGLSGGAYSYSFDVSDPVAQNSPQTITVNLQVTGPILDVSSNTFSFVAEETGANPDDQSLTIRNIGGGTLNWSLDLLDKPDWLTIAPTSGSLEHNVSELMNLSVDVSGLLVGKYSYTVQITDSFAGNGLQNLSVELWVGKDLINIPHDVLMIRDAIDLIAENGTIVVSPGTYYENLRFPGKDFVLTSTDPGNPDMVALTIIDGGGKGRVITFSGSETSNFKLSGFTITNGYASGSYPDYYGGGIHMNYGTNAAIENCRITGNRASVGGGLANCDGPITNCIIIGNKASGDGGGLHGCDGSITNCTITSNTAGGIGGGLYHWTWSDKGQITNCIIWANIAGNWGNQLNDISTTTYCCIQDWTEGGTGNMSSDPLFADAASGDYHLQSQYGRWDPVAEQWVTDTVTSPCIDAGNPASTGWQNEPTPNGTRINMGAYGGTAEASKSAE